MDSEQGRLSQLYADMADAQLLDLLRKRDELTEAAQHALDTQAAARGLHLPEEEQQTLVPGTDENFDGLEDGLYRLWRFSVAGDAETAVAALDDAGVDALVKRARARVDGTGPLVEVPGLDLFIEPANVREAEAVLRKRMQLFPLAESDREDAEPGEDEPFVAGSFATEDEAERFLQALRAENIAAAKREEDDGGGAFWNVEVSFDDLPQATEVAERLHTENA